MYLRDFFIFFTFSMAAIAAPPGVARRDYVLLDEVPWTVRSFNRCIYVPIYVIYFLALTHSACGVLAGFPTTCYYGFWVDTTQDEFATLGPPSCAFGVQGPETASWNSLACSPSYNVSWGYQDSNDGAVLTVV